MTLNLTLPVIAIVLSPQGSSSLGRALAWHWNGWSTLSWGLLGLGLILASFPLVNRLVGSTPFAYGSGIGPLRLPQDWPLLLLLLALWLVSILGEEVMFRGYLQTGPSKRYGALVGLLGAALLFSLRHTPADLYWGWGAPAVQWASRLLQLAASALIFGWIRYRSQSVVATWITHLLLWLLVVFSLTL
jgi:membrane protease YdiL (CAAX protease family)